MFLSNSAKAFLACTLFLLLMQGCKWLEKSDASNASKPSGSSNIPFSTAEPDVFQCEVVRNDGENEQKTFFARKSSNWRFDLSGNEVVIRTDRYYRINSEKKIYTEVPEGDPSANEPDFLADMTFSALKRDPNAKFETLGHNDSLAKYSVTLADSDNAKSVIYVDEKSGLVVKEEFFSLKGQSDGSAKPAFVFELRDLKMEVDDNIFSIPSGYKKLAWNDYLSAMRQNK